MQITGHKARTSPGGSQTTWLLPDSLEIEPFLEELEKSFPVKAEKSQARSRIWYDTDDWSLYRKNLLLFVEHRTWHLIHRESGEVIATFSGKGCEKYRFAWDFPVSRLRSLLEPVVSIRSFLPLLSQETSTSCFRILNKDGKTVAFVYLDTHENQKAVDVFCSVTLKGVRGYDGSFNEVSRFFGLYGIKDVASTSAALDHGVQSLGRFPLDYTSKFSVELQPKMTARHAMMSIYRQLLQTMEHNVNGIINDLDTEFLHDFRVAIRRSRSGFGEIKDVLPPDVVQKVKKDFSWLGRITGPTRDLDVYILDRDKYLNRLPGKLRPNLEHFFVDIENQRELEQKKLVEKLQSEKFQQIISHWHEYLQGSGEYVETANSERPVKKLAREIIFRKYTKVMKDGGAIKRSSPDEDLHRLRIQCKKLRYTLEFFNSLFPAGKMKLAIKQLKQLQDNLGAFNDLSVQQNMLQEYLAGLRPGSRKNQQLAIAIGGLLTNLYHEQQRVREGFYARFHNFSCEENQQLYRKLFH